MTSTPEPRTLALRHALATAESDGAAADLRFLEAWEAEPRPGPGVALRVGQLRRANPDLAAAIRTELALAARAGRPGPSRGPATSPSPPNP